MAETRKAGVRRKAAAVAEATLGAAVAEPTPEAAAAEEPAVTDLAAVRALAAEHGPAAIKALAVIVTEGTSESARIAAANALLERGFGKGRIGGEAEPPPPVETIVVVRFV